MWVCSNSKLRDKGKKELLKYHALALSPWDREKTGTTWSSKEDNLPGEVSVCCTDSSESDWHCAWSRKGSGEDLSGQDRTDGWWPPTRVQRNLWASFVGATNPYSPRHCTKCSPKDGAPSSRLSAAWMWGTTVVWHVTVGRLSFWWQLFF